MNMFRQGIKAFSETNVPSNAEQTIYDLPDVYGGEIQQHNVKHSVSMKNLHKKVALI